VGVVRAGSGSTRERGSSGPPRPSTHRLGVDVQVRLRKVARVQVALAAVQVDARDPRLLGDELAVLGRGGRRQVPAVAAHALVNDEHARVARRLGHHVAEEARAVLRRRPRPERLLDGDDVVVDGLRQPHDGQLVVVVGQVPGGGS
jgi:hypothetical protein